MAAKADDDNQDLEDDENGTTHTGRWTRDEHQAFLTGLRIYGREWKKVAQSIKTRTSAQIRSHAQKYFAKSSSKDRKGGSSAGQRGAGASWLVRCVAATKEALLERRNFILNKQPTDESRLEVAPDEKSVSDNVGTDTLKEGSTAVLSSTNLSKEELLALSVLCSKSDPIVPDRVVKIPGPECEHLSGRRKRVHVETGEIEDDPDPVMKRSKEGSCDNNDNTEVL